MKRKYICPLSAVEAMTTESIIAQSETLNRADGGGSGIAEIKDYSFDDASSPFAWEGWE